jgi:WD40 repeat protein
LEYVPIATVARAIHREVNRLTVADDAFPQQVTATLVDISSDEPEPPFFPNPVHRDDPRVRLRAEVDSGLLPFLDDLDEGLDARHFAERAAGAGPLPDATEQLTGCFTGRAEELRRLSPWLSGEGDASLYVVTGSPGVGKSALLGVLVCAAHPLLREQTRPLWSRIAQRPLQLSNLVAVHARRRGVDDVTRSLSRQLGKQETHMAADLVQAVIGLSDRPMPVIVVDALDEADNGPELMTELLMPLATASRPDGTRAAQLLVGVRPYPDYAPLREVAAAEGGLMNLDEVPARVLEDDLYQYVTELLRTDPEYRLRGGVVGAFAGEVARVLSEQASARREWGEFLVAGLYTRHLLTTRPEPIADPAEAKRLGAQTPRTLPEVLDLDLSTNSAGPLLRRVVTILAHAQGQGMPLTVITRLATAWSAKVPAAGVARQAPLPAGFGTRRMRVTTDDVRQALQTARFYLRQSTDVDGATLYRLFHQGLADHLRQQPVPRMLTGLLAELGPEEARNWEAAEPYLLRHALDHARETGHAAVVLNDPGFLLQLDPSTVLSALDGKLRDVYRASLEVSANPPKINRASLALNAVRAGMTDLGDAIARLPGEPPLTWRPIWIKGRPDTGAPTSQSPMTVTATGIGDLTTDVHTGDLMTGYKDWVSRLALGQLDGKPIAVTGDEDGTVRVWDLTTRQQIGDPMTGHEGRVSALALGQLDGKPIAVTGNRSGTVQIWDLTTRRSTRSMSGHEGGVSALALGELDGTPVVVTGCGDGTVRIRDLTNLLHTGDLATSHEGGVSALALGELDDTPVVVTGGGDGTVRIWDLSTWKQIGDPMTGHEGGVSVLALGQVNGMPVLVTGGGDGTVRVWDLTTPNSPRQMGVHMSDREGGVYVLARRQLDDMLPIVVTRGGDRTARVWDLTARELTGRPITDRLDVVSAAAVAQPDPLRSDEQVQSVADSLARLAASPGAPAIRRLAITEAPSGWIGVLGTDDGRVFTVDLATGTQRHDLPRDGSRVVTAITCSLIAGRSVAVLSYNHGENQAIDLLSGEPITVGHINWHLLPVRRVPRMPASALIVVDGALMEVSGEVNGGISLGDGNSSDRLGHHDGTVTAVAAAYLNDRPVAFIGGKDGTVQVWDLLGKRLVDSIAVPGPVFAIGATNDGNLVIGAGGEALAFRHASVNIQHPGDTT